MYQRREYKEDELVNVGFRARANLAEAVHRAAEKQKARSTSAWLRDLVQDAAAKALGVDPRTLDDEYQRPLGSAPAHPLAAAAASKADQLQALFLEFQERIAKVEAPAAPEAPAKTTRRR